VSTQKSSRFSKVRRLGAIVIAGGMFLTMSAAPVGAQTFGGDGRLFAAVDCHLATNTAYVFIKAENPSAYKTTGLYYFTQVWAKSRNETSYNLISSGQSALTKTWTYYSNNPFANNSGGYFQNTTIISRPSFTGSVNGYYDIYVRYWIAAPGARAWTGPYGFTVAGDRDSSILVTSNNGYGNLSDQVSDCSL
jgi:hypothetical protein